MKLIAISAFCTLFLCPVFGAQYVGIDAGASHSVLTSETHNPKIGYEFGAKYGYRFENGFRTEIAFDYQKCHFKTKYNMGEQDVVVSKEYRSFHTMSYMANVIYDLSQIKVADITPYVGIGVGYCENTETNKIKYDSKVSQDKFRDDRFAYQAIAGAKYDINADYA